MFCWESLDAAIHVDVNLTCPSNVNIVADQIYPLKEHFTHFNINLY